MPVIVSRTWPRCRRCWPRPARSERCGSGSGTPADIGTGRAARRRSSRSRTGPSRISRRRSPPSEPLVWIARDAEIGDRVAEELGAWLGDAAAVAVLEPRTALAYERSELVADETAARVAALAAWRSGRARVLVASVQALLQHTIAPDDLPAEPRELRVGARLHQDQLLRDLFDLGYSPVTEVAGHGEFARRGGIVDVFPPSMELPIRIEFFGDEIDSLRSVRPDRPADDDEDRAGRPAARVGVPAPDRGRGRDPRPSRQGGIAASAIGCGTDLARFEGAADDPLRPSGRRGVAGDGRR